MNVWFVLIVHRTSWRLSRKPLGGPTLLTGPAILRSGQLVANMPSSPGILDEVFGAQPDGHWSEVFSSVHVTLAPSRSRGSDQRPAIAVNDIIVPPNDSAS